jgi:translation initiation factor 1
VRNSRPVYSTESGRVQDRGARPAAETRGGGKAADVPHDGVVRVFRERGGRAGKIVTVIHGLPERGPALEARATELRRLCGAGGTVKDDIVEIQGDHRDRVVAHLGTLGYRVKLAGG